MVCPAAVNLRLSCPMVWEAYFPSSSASPVLPKSAILADKWLRSQILLFPDDKSDRELLNQHARVPKVDRFPVENCKNFTSNKVRKLLDAEVMVL